MEDGNKIILEKMESLVKELGINIMETEKNLVLKGAINSDEKIEFKYTKDESGAVYGYAMYLDENEKKELLEEAKSYNGNEIDSVKKIKPIKSFDGNKNLYILYWGKSSDLFLGRLNAHTRGHRSNGNLHLCDYKFLDEKTIYYSVILVSDNKKLERGLIKKYPPILKTIKK